MNLRIIAVLAAALSLAACEGPIGPAGPQGERGATGEPGPGTRLVLNSTVGSDGVAGVNLPTEAGTISDPPGVTCYLSETSAGPYLVVALDLDGLLCGIAQSGGNLQALITSAPPGWSAKFVVVY